MLPHFEQFGTVFLSQFAVEYSDGSLQVFPLLCYFLLSFLQLLQLFLSLPPQSFQVLILLLIQEAMEILKLCSDFSFQGIKTVLKDVWTIINSGLDVTKHPVWQYGELLWIYTHLFCVKLELLCLFLKVMRINNAAAVPLLPVTLRTSLSLLLCTHLPRAWFF